MSGMLEDLRERADELETALVKLCRRSGHDEWVTAYPSCIRHRLTDAARALEECSTCKAFRCCEEEEAKSS